MDLGGDDCTSNGIIGLVFTIMSAVAQFERERIAERISDVKVNQKTKGRFLGGQRAPFGYRVGDNGQLVSDPDEQALVTRMGALRHEGHSLRKIADAIKADAGRNVHPETIKRALSAAYVVAGPGAQAGDAS